MKHLLFLTLFASVCAYAEPQGGHPSWQWKSIAQGNGIRPQPQRPLLPLAAATDRPAIEKIRPANLGPAFWKKYEKGEHKLLRAKLYFLAEIFALYPDHEKFFLARDCDSLSDLARTLYADDPETLKRLHLVNISRDIVKDASFKNYLDQTGIFTDTATPALLVDQGFEGSIPNAVWQNPSSRRTVRSFFVSSVHPDIPSSRVASRPYAPLYNGDHDEASGDLVDDLEDLPHYLPVSASRLEMRHATWVPVAEIAAQELKTHKETAEALAYMRLVRAFGLDPRVRDEFHAMREAISRLREYLVSQEPLLPARTKTLALGAKMAAGPEVLQDFREQFWKGHLPVSAARFQEFWLQLSGEPPYIDDMTEDVVDDAHRVFPDTKTWLSEDWAQSAQSALEQGVMGPKTAFGLRLPRLWEALLDACQGAPEHLGICLDGLAQSPHLEEMPRAKWMPLFDAAPENPLVLAMQTRLNAIPTYARGFSQVTAGITYEEIRASIRAANLKTRQLGDRWKVGHQRRLGEKLGDGTHCDVYGYGRDSVIKLPAEAEDAAYLEAEKRIYADLLERAPDIGLVPITEAHPEGFFLVKDRVRESQLGTQVAKKGLNEKQEADLERLFEAARRYARATGLGLDLKADNLAWVEGEWKLIEAGPRLRHVPYGFTLEPANFTEYKKIWTEEDLPGPAKIKPEQVERVALPAPIPRDNPQAKAKEEPTTRPRSARRSDPWWTKAPHYVSPIKKIESLVEIQELPKAELIHHLDYLEIARKEGRIFENPPKGWNPGDDTYTWVLFRNGDWIFGKDALGLELGVKHFQLAQKRKVVAAGEMRNGAFSLQSGSFSRALLRNSDYSEQETADAMRRMFQDRLGLVRQFTEVSLIAKRDFVSIQALLPYCANPTFYRLHARTICASWDPFHCPAQLIGQ